LLVAENGWKAVISANFLTLPTDFEVAFFRLGFAMIAG
jgi:hypothetical protein